MSSVWRERGKRKKGVEERDREVSGQEGDEGVTRWVHHTMSSLAGVPVVKCREERGREGKREKGGLEKSSLPLAIVSFRTLLFFTFFFTEGKISFLTFI